MDLGVLVMNDFTKEELEELNHILHRNAWQAIDVRRMNLLHKKIQYMIDNYSNESVCCIETQQGENIEH